MTNKTIYDVDAISPEYTKESGDIYALTDGGITVLEIKNRENKHYGVVSAVTDSQDTDDRGRKTDASEDYAMNTLFFVLNFLNADDWFGRTGVLKTPSSLLGYLLGLKKQLDDAEIAENITIAVTVDENNDKVGIVDVGVKAWGILKHLHWRIQQIMGGS
jgi:hypothetical protein